MKSNTIKTGIVIGMMTCFYSVNAAAQSTEKPEKGEKPPTVEELFRKMDANEDGKLSQKEVKGPLKESFAKIDIDEDGFITKKEMEKAPKPKRQKPPKRN